MMKVTGVVVPATGLKDFIIRYNGEDHYCRRSGQKFEWNGHRGSLKALKGAIVEHHEKEEAPPSNTTHDPETGNVWHTDAAAMLALVWLSKKDVKTEWVFDCLGKSGYLDEKGHIDQAAAQRAIDYIYQQTKEPVRHEAAAVAPVRKSWNAPKGKSPWNN